MLGAIGTTPLERLARVVPAGAADVWITLEYYNPTGSPEKRRSMEVFGAELDVLNSEGGKLTPDLVPRMMARAREIAAVDSGLKYLAGDLYGGSISRDGGI
jgi:cysteine synthase